MNSLRLLAAVAVAGIVGIWAGCNKAGSNSSNAAPAKSATGSVASTFAPGIPTKAQPKLQTLRLWVGPEELITELALTELQQHTGMMFRTNIAENEAMLFVFPFPHQASFWMMNTYVPLSAAYIDPDGVIQEIHKLEPLNTNSVTAASDRIQYVLETREGWFDRHNIRTGMVVRSEYGPLRSTFTRKQ